MSSAPVHFHALLWIDHSEAKVFHFNADASEQERIKSSHPHQHLHHKANSRAGGHAPIDKAFFENTAKALAAVGALLVTGPGGAKTEFVNWLKSHHPAIAGRISAVETLDHPSDGALLALARKFFKADDRMHV